MCLCLDEAPGDEYFWSYLNCYFGKMFRFPRVCAAEDMQSRDEKLPKFIGSSQIPESGWDRLRELLHRDEMKNYPEEVIHIWKSAVVAGFVGMVYGGIPAARHAKIRYIEQSQAEVYKNRLEALRSAQDAAVRGFIRYGWRWSWRVTAFVTIFKEHEAQEQITVMMMQDYTTLTSFGSLELTLDSVFKFEGTSMNILSIAESSGGITDTVSTGLSVYHDQNLLRYYSAAGAITGGLFRMNLGLGGFLAGSAIGAVMGIPAGALILGIQKVNGETLRERKHRQRQENYKLKLEEWRARLNVTEDLVHEIAGKKSMESDLEKLEELLKKPRNPSSSVQEKS